MTTVNLNAAYFPAVEFAQRGRDGRHPALRRPPGRSTATSRRRARRLHRRAERLLRPDPAALAGLHDLPVRHGGARQDLRAARRASPTSSTRPTRVELPPPAARRDRASSDVTFAYRTAGRHAGLALDRRRPARPAGPDGRARRRDGRGQVDVRQARRALLRPDRAGAVLVDGHDLRDVDVQLAALADGHRAPGGLPVQRHDRARTSPSGAPDADRRGARGGRRAVGAWEFVAGSRARPRHRGRRARRAALGRPAPARGLRPRARRRPADPRPRRGDVERRPAHREAASSSGLRRLLAGRTAIVIAHRLSTIRQAGRIVVLERRPHRRAGHPRRAARGARAPTGALYRDWAEQAAA